MQSMVEISPKVELLRIEALVTSQDTSTLALIRYLALSKVLSIDYTEIIETRLFLEINMYINVLCDYSF